MEIFLNIFRFNSSQSFGLLGPSDSYNKVHLATLRFAQICLRRTSCAPNPLAGRCSIMKVNNIKGALLEHLVRNLLKSCGFTTVKPDGLYTFERSGLFFVNG